MIEDAIKKFNEQLRYEPAIQNAEKLGTHKKFAVIGMGGSALAADLLRVWNPKIDLVLHRDYGLPQLSDESWHDRLVIASSYSGNTEETIAGFEDAHARGLPLAAISVGGKLAARAKELGVPYVQLPDTGIQPRMALGFSFNALLALMDEKETLTAAHEVGTNFSGENCEAKGKEIAETLKNAVPIIYSSRANGPLAYVWKIVCNETGKIPAFVNVFPEMNHNELTGFDVAPTTWVLSANMHILMLHDSEDNPRIQKRMQVAARLLEEKGIKNSFVELKTGSPIIKIFSSVVTAFWTAYYLAKGYGVEPEAVPLVETFKKLIADN